MAGGGGRGKRLTALAEWEFGGGRDYCANCDGVCAACPRQVNRPQTAEGWAMVALMGRLDGQLRLLAGPAGGAVFLGWEAVAALALGRALGLPPWLLAEWLPAIERAAMAKLNEQK